MHPVQNVRYTHVIILITQLKVVTEHTAIGGALLHTNFHLKGKEEKEVCRVRVMESGG